MRDGLPIRLGAVTLALLTAAALVFAVLNFQQRARFIIPDDGVTWVDSAQGVVALHVTPASPAAKAGIREGDIAQSVESAPTPRATDVTRILWKVGPWAQVPYKILRNGIAINVPLVTVPQDESSSIENYLRITALLYLFIGLFIFARRWNAPRAIHFYIFCLASFVLYSFHYTGKLNSFDWIIYWSNVTALLLQPALLAHFALVFPERHKNSWLKAAAIYALPSLLLLFHISIANGTLDFIPSIGNRDFLATVELVYMACYSLIAAGIFLASYFRTPHGVLKQQLKWVTGGTLVGFLPFCLFYVLPRLISPVSESWMKLSVLSLALIPLCFGYAIIRYRLMDVDIIFKRGIAYTFATAGVVGIYFAGIAIIGELFHTAWPTGPFGGVIAIVVAAFLFQPLREWMQARLDHFFYRDRLDYRRTLIEFGRALTNQVHFDPLMGSVLSRISQTLLVDRLAIFLEDAEQPGRFTLTRGLGVQLRQNPDLSFLNPKNPALERGCLFYESSRAASGESESVRTTIDQLALNYFIPCRVHDETVAVLGLGKTVDGDYLSSDDLELVSTIAGYVAIAVENARLYQSLEQKAAQIERLKDFSENIVESLKIGVVTTDLNDVIESWNPQLEALLEVSREAALGQKLDAILPRDLGIEIAARAKSEHVSGIYKLHLDTKSGRHVVVNVSTAPLLGKDGKQLGRLVLLDDITQRVRLEEEMIQTEKLTSLGLLAAGVAHEVNTPLAVISNYIQMLAKQIPEDDPRQKTLERIVKQTFRASEIVNNLLNFSRTGAAALTEVNLNNLLDETLAMVQHPL